jgi:hypothetical protein
LRVQFIERADVRHNFLLQIPERNPECASGTLPCQRGSSSGIKLIKAKSVPGVDVMITIFRDFRHFLAKNQCSDQIFAKFSFVLSQKRQFFADFFGENI